MGWEPYIRGFKAYLKLERSLSANSIQAYLGDVKKFESYLNESALNLAPKDVDKVHVSMFLKWISEQNLNARSQNRIISGLKAFFKYLMIEKVIETSPLELIE